MAFNIQSWGRISGSANNTVSTLQGSGASTGAPNFFSYVSFTDNASAIESPDYFNGQAVEVNIGDTIYAVGSDGVRFLIVTARSVSPPSVTVSPFTVATGSVTGPGLSTDNALVRWDGITGTVIQNSNAILTDADALTGLVSIVAGQLKIELNTITPTIPNSDLELSGTGIGKVTVNSLKDNSLTITSVVATDNTDTLVSIANATAGFVLTSNGAVGAPTFQPAAAGGVTSVTGTAGRITSTGGVTPIINLDPAYVAPITQGGTGVATLTTANGTLVAGTTATSPVVTVAPGTAGFVLTSTGAATPPAYAAIPSTISAWQFISSVVIGGATASANFINIDPALAAIKIIILNCNASVNGSNFILRTSTNNGASYDAGANDYSTAETYNALNSTPSHNVGGNATNAQQITLTTSMDNAANLFANCEVTIFNPGSALFHHVTWNGIFPSGGDFYNIMGGGVRKQAAAINAVQLLFSAGTIAQGGFYLYGIRT